MKRKSNKSVILRVVVLFVCAYFIVTLINVWQTYNEKKKERDVLLLQKNQLMNDIDAMKSLLDSDSNAELIEKAARERLGYIYSNEQIFIDISGN